MVTTTHCALSHTGHVRSNNEDAWHADARHGLWIVADGMGGHEAGEVASAITIETIVACMKSTRTADALSRAIHQAHHAILAATQQGRGARGMGSTVVAAQTGDKGFHIAWVGDSRAYLWQQSPGRPGVLQQLTVDHSYVQMLVQSGAITPEEAENHPDKNIITQCLGSLELPDVRVETCDLPWQREHCTREWLILCSDGLNDELEHSQIAAVLGNASSPEQAAQRLLDAALDNGGRDNTTILVIARPEPLKWWQRWFGFSR